MINYEERIKELNQIKDKVVLEKDPLKQGLNYFLEKFYEIQSCRDRVLSILIESIWNKTIIASELNDLQNQYDISLSSILIREDVKTLKSNELRLAVANNELKDLVTKLKQKEKELSIAESFYKTVVVFYDELKSKNDNLAQQFLTVRAMLNIEPSLKDTILKVELK